jgi:uncharacterized repeat protein (TIGR01451 family)
VSAGTFKSKLMIALAAIVGTLAIAASPATAATTLEMGGPDYESQEPYDLDGEFNEFIGAWYNTGDEATDMQTLRITFDPNELDWQFTEDSDEEDPSLVVDVGATGVIDAQPLLADTCTRVEVGEDEVSYECDLEDTTLPADEGGVMFLYAFMPVDGFDYGSADVTVEVESSNAPTVSKTSTLTWRGAPHNLIVDGGYAADPELVDPNFVGEYRDYDAESTGVAYEAGDTVPYRMRLTNPEHDEDPTSLAHGIKVVTEIPIEDGYATEFLHEDVTASGSLSLEEPCEMTDEEEDDYQQWTCRFDGVVDVDGEAFVTIPIRFLDAMDVDVDDEDIEFEITTANNQIASGSNPSVDEMTYATPDSCDLDRFFGSIHPESGQGEGSFRYTMTSRSSLATFASGDPIRVELPCDAFDVDSDGFTGIGTWQESNYYAGGNHTGTTGDAPLGPDGQLAFTWTPDTPALPDAGEILDTYGVYAYPTDGTQTYDAVVHIQAEQQSDLSVVLTGPTATSVAAAGSEASWTATVSNSGPDAAASSKLRLTLPTGAGFVSATPGTGGDTCSNEGALVTCTIANLASGQSRTITIVGAFKPGTNGLNLPMAATASAEVWVLGEHAVDMVSSNDTKSVTTALTAVTDCPAGQTGTPPNCTTPTPTCATNEIGTYPTCVKPQRFTGNGTDQTFRGGGNDDRFTGSSGDERFFGGGGNDTARGGSGNDVLSGGPGRDVLTGGRGNDRIFCGTGRDRAFGGPGNDFISCRDGSGGDLLNGGTGRDRCIGDRGDIFVGCETILVPARRS